ncbi:hypothetical protein LZ32DRAFT_304817 [Colletotrichum eremochloae]|nr:hypothetical protein LZ32DRAFT_304817 [Colletotrichum eremochloae]
MWKFEIASSARISSRGDVSLPAYEGQRNPSTDIARVIGFQVAVGSPCSGWRGGRGGPFGDRHRRSVSGPSSSADARPRAIIRTRIPSLRSEACAQECFAICACFSCRGDPEPQIAHQAAISAASTVSISPLYADVATRRVGAATLPQGMQNSPYGSRCSTNRLR